MPPRLTHFLCIPLVTPASLPQLASSLARFAQDKAIQRNSIAGNSKRPPPPSNNDSSDSDSDSDRQDARKPNILQEAYIPSKAVRPVGTLHLTLGVMNLNDKSKIDEACELLEQLDVKTLLLESQKKESPSNELIASQPEPDHANTTSLSIQLKGLHAMQRPQRTRVLYAEPVDSSGRLLSFCNSIRSKFLDAGNVVDEDRELKLHATIVNTVYVSKGGRGSKSGKLEFDATDLIERWEDEIWAEVIIEKIAICEMGAKEDSNGDVRYVEIAEVKL